MLQRPVVVAAIDFSSVSARVAEEAARLARGVGADLTLLHVTPPGSNPRDHEILVEERRTRLDSIARPLRQPGLHVRSHVQFGDAAEEILRELSIERAEFLVLGTRARSGLGRFLMGSVADEMMRHAPCPVLAIRESPAGDVAMETS